MKIILILISLLSHEVFACKMAPLGAYARSIRGIVDFVEKNETPDSKLRALYFSEGKYLYEILKDSKCSATEVFVDMGKDCNPTVTKIADKIACRLHKPSQFDKKP